MVRFIIRPAGKIKLAMIRDPKGWEAWEAARQTAEPPDYERNLRWFESALEHALELGGRRR